MPNRIDGGVNDLNANKLISCGADVLVAGNYIFNQEILHSILKN